MTEWMDAAAELCAVLEAENACLGQLRLAAASRLLDRKQAAVARLDGAGPPKGAEAMPVLQELAALAEQNRRLLDRAMGAQARLIELIARAARVADGRNRYGRPAARTTPPIAISARA